MIVMKNHISVGLGSILLIGCSSPSDGTALSRSTATPDRDVPLDGRVEYVIDGDTIIVTTRARRVRVRLLGIDAPEDTGRPDCFGGQATAELRRLLPAGSRVLLVRDRHRVDPYGRHLGYVWRADGTFINPALVRGGFATTLFLRPRDPGGQIRAELTSAQNAARRERAGLWRACLPPPCSRSVDEVDRTARSLQKKGRW